MNVTTKAHYLKMSLAENVLSKNDLLSALQGIHPRKGEQLDRIQELLKQNTAYHSKTARKWLRLGPYWLPPSYAYVAWEDSAIALNAIVRMTNITRDNERCELSHLREYSKGFANFDNQVWKPMFVISSEDAVTISFLEISSVSHDKQHTGMSKGMSSHLTGNQS